MCVCVCTVSVMLLFRSRILITNPSLSPNPCSCVSPGHSHLHGFDQVLSTLFPTWKILFFFLAKSEFVVHIYHDATPDLTLTQSYFFTEFFVEPFI